MRGPCRHACTHRHTHIQAEGPGLSADKRYHALVQEGAGLERAVQMQMLSGSWVQLHISLQGSRQSKQLLTPCECSHHSRALSLSMSASLA